MFLAPITRGNLQVHWPEGNVLIPHGIRDQSGVPDYNAVVEVLSPCLRVSSEAGGE